MIPCITKKSVKQLYTTADERYHFSNDFFRKTHFPQTLNRYYKNHLIEKITEDSFLEELEGEHLLGNRVYIIYGSTGSGKSELLCWLRDQWTIKKNERPIIRISRSELNPQILIKKCYQSLNIKLNDLVIDENRWEILLNKPIAIINQLVWSALNDIFEKDEDIVPVAMLLRPVIEKNIIKFTKQILKGTIHSPLEVMTNKQFKHLIENTTVPIHINYQKFRNTLLKKLDEYLFQGLDIKTIFKNLSKHISKKGIRPVILIDDLVQSMNLYASDILDFFLTLEEGNWDVVIGLTPGVLEGNENEKELKSRINTLDTIDDRVKKLWLSDESGNTFYSLDKNQAKDYMAHYLSALKEVNGFLCAASCPNYHRCSDLLLNSTNLFLPFNESLIERIFDGLPEGKGALRYMIIHMKELLNFFLDGKTKDLEKMKSYFSRDMYADHNDPLIKLLAEMYSDPSLEEYHLSPGLLEHFNKEEVGQNIKIKKLKVTIEFQEEIPVIKRRNESHTHIRDWIEGKKINPQLLETVRTGVGIIVHEVVKGTSMMRENTSRVVKATATIQRTEVMNRLKYPILIGEGKNDYINLSKHINLLDVSVFQKLKMQNRPDAFLKIANDMNIAEWIYQTEWIKEEWKIELEKGLGYNMIIFSYFFKKFIQKVYNIGQMEWTFLIENPIKKEHLEIAENLFQDWYALRDNIVDQYLLEEIKGEEEFESHFLCYNPSKALNKFQIANYPLQTFMINLQKKIKSYIENLTPIVMNEMNEIKELIKFIKNVPMNIDEQLEKINSIENIVLGEIYLIDKIISWFSEDENKAMIKEVQNQQITFSNIRKFLDNTQEVRVENLLDMDDYLKNELKVRSQVRKHFLNLIEKGETHLPNKQWKGILRDMEEISPNFFDHIKLIVNINK